MANVMLFMVLGVTAAAADDDPEPDPVLDPDVDVEVDTGRDVMMGLGLVPV